MKLLAKHPVYSQCQNILQKVGKSSKVRQVQETLLSAFWLRFQRYFQK